MGMFDIIIHRMECPKCNKEIEFSEQIKWADCIMHGYRVGDTIPADDGEYDYATMMRPELVVECDYCGEKIRYKAIVENGILTKIEII